MPTSVKECIQCHSEIVIRARKAPANQKYCSPACRNAYQNARVLGKRTPTLIPPGTTGCVSELLISADLLEQGFSVFRSLSPSCPCDLAVLYEGRLLSVEVRTGYRNQITGDLLYLKKHQGVDLFGVAILQDGRGVYYVGVTEHGRRFVQVVTKKRTCDAAKT